MAERICESCGGSVDGQIGRGRPRRFCLTCRPRTYEPKPLVVRPRASKRSRAKPPSARRCIECGEVFYAKTRAACCAPCRPARRRRQSDESRRRAAVRSAAAKACDVCFGPMPPGAVKRCSPRCTEEARRHALMGWPPNSCDLNIRSCERCEGAFILRKATGPARRRCDACSVPEADRLRAKRARREAAVLAGQPVRLADVAERDGYRCQLCRRAVDMGRKHPDPLSASMDHIIPLSRGGEHTMVNVQLAHLGCNMSKGAGAVGEQLRLVG